MKQEQVAVIGGGSWATAVAKILLENRPQISWWVREEEICKGLLEKGRNPLYLQGVQFDNNRLDVSCDIHAILRQAETVVLVVPAVFLPGALKDVSPEELRGKRICSAVKGIIPDRAQVVCEYIRDSFRVPENRISVISGPSHAEEIALNRLTYLTAASPDEDFARHIAECFSCEYVKTLCSNDMYGIAYATVLKNIYALSVGMAKGLGYGDNFAAVLVSNALEEMRRFLSKIYPLERNLNTAPYLGDLLVTSYSQFSRNRTFGNMIGQGYSVKSATLEMKMVAEGYYAAGSMQRIREREGLEMPVLEAVYTVLYQGGSARSAFKNLELLFR